MLVTCRWTVCSLSTSRSAIAAVREPLGEQREHLALARRQLGSGGAAGAPSSRSRSRAVADLALGGLAAAERGEAGRQREPGLGGLERRAVAREGVDGVLEQHASAVVVAAGGRQHALRDVGARTQRGGPDLALDLAQGRQRGGGAVEVAGGGARPHEQLQRRRSRQPAMLGHVAQEPLDQLGGLLRGCRGRAPSAPGRADRSTSPRPARTAAPRRWAGPAGGAARRDRRAGRRPSPGATS